MELTFWSALLEAVFDYIYNIYSVIVDLRIPYEHVTSYKIFYWYWYVLESLRVLRWFDPLVGPLVDSLVGPLVDASNSFNKWLCL